MFHDLSVYSGTDYLKEINRFGVESGLFEQVRVEKITKKVSGAPLLVYVDRGNRSFLLNQVGVGVSQVVPVLIEAVEAAASKGRKIALFQQPELHLHPVAQAALGSFFLAMARRGMTGFLETHSSFLIDRLRSDLRGIEDEAIRNKMDCKVIYCHSDEVGNHLAVCKIDGLGNITGAPDSYYDFFLNESIRTMV
jgi:predicted ATPase